MSLASKISAGFLLLVALMVTLSWSQLALIFRLHKESRNLSQNSFEAVSLSLQMQGQVSLLEEFSNKFRILRDAGYATELEKLRAETGHNLRQLEQLDLSSAERRQIELFVALWQPYVAAAPELEAEILRERGGVDAFRELLGDRFNRMRSQLAALMKASQEAMAAQVAASGERVARARTIAWGSTLAGLLVAVLISFGIVRSLVKPLRHLARGTREVARGNFDYRVPGEGGRELAALAADFNLMAARLNELDQLKKEFVSSVSHDLKAPLAAMQETTKLLLEELPGPLAAEQRHLLELNLKCGDRLFHMIDDLLSLARLEAGRVEYDMKPQDLVALTRSVCEEMSALMRDKELKVETGLPAEPVVVECDGLFVSKALQNLIANAVKYTPAGGELGVRIHVDARGAAAGVVGDEPPAVVIDVWDSGPGVPDEEKSRIFERFYRLNRDASGPRGTGLGLTIARQVVAGHGGRLWIEDRPRGGSVFRLLLWRRPRTGGKEGAGEVRRGARAELGTTETSAFGVASWLLVATLALGSPLLSGCRTSGAPDPSLPPSEATAEAAFRDPLELGDLAFVRNDYQAASEAYDAYLAAGAPQGAEDRVIFCLALMKMPSASPVYSPRQARELLQELLDRFPDSPYHQPAGYLMTLQNDNRKLRRQLEQLKQIDLERSQRKP